MMPTYLIMSLFLMSTFAQPPPPLTCNRDISRDRPDVPVDTFQQLIPATPVNGNIKTPHECLRPCNSSVLMTCNYEFVVEWYSTMSLACRNCPCNAADCVREGCVPADGVPRPIALANRELPGPAIEVCQGDRVIVDVVNQMDNGEGVSIHWHGILQKGTPYMDGVSLITQCPITPYSSFRYDFIAGKAGTHWWHGHSGFERSDGLYGSLIVRQPDEENVHRDLYDYDLHEHTAILIEWFPRSSLHEWVRASYLDLFDRRPPSTLINDKGQFAVYVDRMANTSHAAPRQIFEVQKGFRYRFRVIHAGFKGSSYKISVDNHTLTLIASDGGDVQPVEVYSIEMFPGERYDFVLNATQEMGNYWMKIEIDGSNTDKKALAIIRYRGAGDSNPTEDPSEEREGLRYERRNTGPAPDIVTVNQLVAVENATLPQEGKRTEYMVTDVSQQINPSIGEQTAQVNNRAFVPTGYSLLSQYNADEDGEDICDYDDQAIDARCENEFCKCTQVLHVELNQTIELVLIHEARDNLGVHPFHMHGFAYRILAEGKFDTRKTRAEVIQMDENGEIKRNFDSPPLKDTVRTPSPGYTVIQFVADNPGWWLFHCHISIHLHEGMAIVIHVGDKSDLPPIPSNFPRCGSFKDLPDSDTTSSPEPTTYPSHSYAPDDHTHAPNGDQSSLAEVVLILAIVVAVLSGIVVILLLVLVCCLRGRASGMSTADSNGMSSHENPAFTK